MNPQSTKCHVNAFIGLVNYYRYMWYRRSRFLRLLTALTPDKVIFTWTSVEQKAF